MLQNERYSGDIWSVYGTEKSQKSKIGENILVFLNSWRNVQKTDSPRQVISPLGNFVKELV